METKTQMTSEQARLAEIHAIADKTNWMARHKKSPSERAELKRRMASFPNKNHSPVGYNQ